MMLFADLSGTEWVMIIGAVGLWVTQILTTWKNVNTTQAVKKDIEDKIADNTKVTKEVVKEVKAESLKVAEVVAEKVVVETAKVAEKVVVETAKVAEKVVVETAKVAEKVVVETAKVAENHASEFRIIRDTINGSLEKRFDLVAEKVLLNTTRIADLYKWTEKVDDKLDRISAFLEKDSGPVPVQIVETQQPVPVKVTENVVEKSTKGET